MFGCTEENIEKGGEDGRVEAADRRHPGDTSQGDSLGDGEDGYLQTSGEVVEEGMGPVIRKQFMTLYVKREVIKL